MKNKTLLIIGCGLLAIGLLKPDFSSVLNLGHTINKPSVVDVVKPENKDLLDSCFDVIKTLKTSNRKSEDAKRLSSLYSDLALLVSLDGENEVIKTTDDVRQANRLAGLMLQLDLKGKYKDLPAACNNVLVSAIGDDSVLLDKALRAKAVEGFKALAWATNEASK